MHSNRYLDFSRPGHAQQFLQSWTDMYVRPDSYPLTLADVQDHADAFMRAATVEGISQIQIQEAVSGSDMRDVMIVMMRKSVESALEERAKHLLHATQP